MTQTILTKPGDTVEGILLGTLPVKPALAFLSRGGAVSILRMTPSLHATVRNIPEGSPVAITLTHEESLPDGSLRKVFRVETPEVSKTNPRLLAGKDAPCHSPKNHAQP